MPEVNAESVRDTLKKFVESDDFTMCAKYDQDLFRDTLECLISAIDDNNATEISIFLPLALDILEVHVL